MDEKDNELIKEIESKDVKDRTEEEHLFLIVQKYDRSVRKYLLSMGKFKEPQEEFKSIDELKPANKFDRDKFSVRQGYEHLLFKTDLKNEAIKRAKYYDKKIKEEEDLTKNDNVFGINRVRLRGKKEEIMDFALLTEEDLK